MFQFLSEDVKLNPLMALFPTVTSWQNARTVQFQSEDVKLNTRTPPFPPVSPDRCDTVDRAELAEGPCKRPRLRLVEPDVLEEEMADTIAESVRRSSDGGVMCASRKS